MPDKVIQIDGVGTVAFPDSMSDADIGAVIQKQHPELHQDKTKTFGDQLAHVASDYWDQINPAKMIRGARDAVNDIPGAVKAYGARNAEIFQKAKDAYNAGDYSGAVAHGLHYLLNGVPGVGSTLDEASDQARSGDIPGALAKTAGLATNMIVGPKLPGAAGAAANAVRSAVDAAPEAAANAATFGKAAAKAGGADVAMGAAKTAAGLATFKTGSIATEMGLGAPLVRNGTRQATTGVRAGYAAGKEAVIARLEQLKQDAATPAAAPDVVPPSRQLGPGPIATPPPADTSGPIPGWKPTILENEQTAPPPTDARQVFKKAETVAQPDSVATVPTDTIKADPARFQFKANVGQGGAGEELRSVDKFDPEKSGILSVWKDPANGQTYVVNGHHRLELAQRAGAPNVTVRYLDAATAQEARTKGALINIAEGRGDSLDAAKVFRDTGLDADGLKAEGISLTGTVAKEGLALSKLDPKLFSQVVSGDLPASRAAIIGEGIPSPEDQRAFADVLDKAEKSGKRPTNDQVQEMIRLANSRPRVTETQDSLFGAHEISRGLISEAAEVSDYVRRRMGQESKLFATVGSERAATQLGENGNVIDAQANATTATRTSQAQALYDKLSTSPGNVNDALNRAAAEMAKPGANASHVKQMAYSQIKSALLKQADALTGTASAPETPAAAPETPAVASGAAPAPATPQEPTTIPFSKPGMTKEVAEAKARTKKAQALATILHEGGISHERMVSDLSLKEQQLQLGAIAKGQRINQTGDMSPESVAETLFELRKLERKAAPAAKPTMMAPSPAYQKALQRPGALKAAQALADAQR